MILDPWSSILDTGSWFLEPGSWILDPVSWTQDPGSRISEPGSMILDPGSWAQDPGSYPGCWTQDPGSYPGCWTQDPTGNRQGIEDILAIGNRVKGPWVFHLLKVFVSWECASCSKRHISFVSGSLASHQLHRNCASALSRLCRGRLRRCGWQRWARVHVASEQCSERSEHVPNVPTNVRFRRSEQRYIMVPGAWSPAPGTRYLA